MPTILDLDLNVASLFSLSSTASAKKVQHPSHAAVIDTWHLKIQSLLDSVQKFSTYI
jgi:hypothetical protein